METEKKLAYLRAPGEWSKKITGFTDLNGTVHSSGLPDYFIVGEHGEIIRDDNYEIVGDYKPRDTSYNPNYSRYLSSMARYEQEHPWDAWFLDGGVGNFINPFYYAHLAKDGIDLASGDISKDEFLSRLRYNTGLAGLLNLAITYTGDVYNRISDGHIPNFRMLLDAEGNEDYMQLHPKIAAGTDLALGLAIPTYRLASKSYKNFKSNGGFKTAGDIIRYKASSPAYPSIPINWGSRYGGGYSPRLNVQEPILDYSKMIKPRFNLNRSGSPELVPTVIEDYSRVSPEGYKILLSSYDNNIVFIPEGRFLETHFGVTSTDPSGVYVNNLGTLFPMGNPSENGGKVAMRTIARLPKNVYYGPDAEISSYMRRLDEGSSKFSEIAKMLMEPYNPNLTTHLTADGWKLHVRPNKSSISVKSNTHYVSLDDMIKYSEGFKYKGEPVTKIVPLEFGEELLRLGKIAQDTGDLTPLNKFLENNNLPNAFIRDGKVRFPTYSTKTK